MHQETAKETDCNHHIKVGCLSSREVGATFRQLDCSPDSQEPPAQQVVVKQTLALSRNSVIREGCVLKTHKQKTQNP